MAYTIEWNLKEFGRELNRYLEASGKSLVDVVNTKSYFIAKQAMAFTPRANKAKILADMGARRTYRMAISKSKNPNKAGKIRARAKPIEWTNDTAVNIIQARQHEKGEPPLTKVEAKAKARKMIAAKTRAVGTLKAGWHDIMKRFANAALQRYGFNVSHTTGGMRILRGRGQGRLANKHSIRNPVAVLTYNVNKDKMSGIHPLVKKAANMAISAERGSMRAYAAKKLQEVNRRFAPLSP
jgi:hypothetical protein